MACIDKVSKVVADSLSMCIYACIHRQAHAICNNMHIVHLKRYWECAGD